LGLTDIAEDCLQESRTGRNIRHHLVPLLRQSIFSRLAGYNDINDADRLAQDPTVRVVVGWQGEERKAASTSEMGRFETEFLTQEDNLKGLARINTQWMERAMAHTLHRRVILDMDSSESPVHGQQEGAAYNGHSADDWEEVLKPVVDRYLTATVRLLFMLTPPSLSLNFTIIWNQSISAMPSGCHPTRCCSGRQRTCIRPTEWPSPKPIVSYHDSVYQAQSWNVSRRVVAKMEQHQGELFPRVGFIVTNLSYPPKGIVRFYNGRGTAEQGIKEGKYTLNWTRLSCHKFVANHVRLKLFVLAYNLGNFLRRLVLPEPMKHWSLTSLQTRMIKTGGRLVSHARKLVFQLAKVLVTREMLGGILERIGRLRLTPG